MYKFDTQLAEGESHEAFLDNFFSRWYRIRSATRSMQRKGIDRIFTRSDRVTHLVEYKADSTASRTGNAFVETISVDTKGKRGWAYTSQSNYLIYYLPIDMLIYIIHFPVLRAHLPRWTQSYPVRRIKNQGYHTHGLLVPLDEFERISKEVISI